MIIRNNKIQYFLSIYTFNIRKHFYFHKYHDDNFNTNIKLQEV